MISRQEMQTRLPALLKLGVPHPPRTLDGASIRAARRPPRRSARRWAVPALAAATVIAIAASVSVLAGHQHEHGRSTASSPHPLGVTAVNDHRRARTVEAVHRLAAAFEVPSSWRETHRAPSRDLRLSKDDPASYSIGHGRLWVTTGNAESAMRYFTSHLPAGVGVHSPATYATPRSASALLSARGRWLKPSLYGGVEISVVAQRLRPNQVGVELTVTAHWLPKRTPAQTIPASTTGATVVVTGDTHSNSRSASRLNAGQARTLAHTINGLAVSYPIDSLCPVVGPSATITFASPSGPRIVTASSYCTAGVVFHSTAGRTPLYLAPGHIFATVLDMLHLPANFGR